VALLGVLRHALQLPVILLHVLASQVEAVVAAANMVDAEAPGDGGVQGSAVGGLSDSKVADLLEPKVVEDVGEVPLVGLGIELLSSETCMKNETGESEC